MRYFLRQALPLRQPPSERLDKPLIALAALGLRAAGCAVSGQRWRDREPEAHEQSQRFVGDRDVSFQPLDLSRQAISRRPSAAGDRVQQA